MINGPRPVIGRAPPLLSISGRSLSSGFSTSQAPAAPAAEGSVSGARTCEVDMAGGDLDPSMRDLEDPKMELTWV